MNYSQLYTPEEVYSANWSKYDLLQTRFFVLKWIKLRPFGYAMNFVISKHDSAKLQKHNETLLSRQHWFKCLLSKMCDTLIDAAMIVSLSNVTSIYYIAIFLLLICKKFDDKANVVCNTLRIIDTKIHIIVF